MLLQVGKNEEICNEVLELYLEEFKLFLLLAERVTSTFWLYGFSVIK